MVYEYLITTNKEQFLNRTRQIAAALGIDPDWLMVVMKIESDLNPAAVNRMSNATGLIQFMPVTAAGLGTSCTELKSMTNVQQLEYVYKYFKPWAGRLHSAIDLYIVTFFPAALGKPDNYILQTATLKADTIAGQNMAYDLDKNREITAGELRASISKRLPGEIVAAVQTAAGSAAEYLKKKVNPTGFILIILAISGAGYVIYKQLKK